MARNKSACEFKHTPISPAKNDIRCQMVFNGLKKNQNVATISHGLVDMALAYKRFTGWNGSILACDKDPIVVNAIRDVADLCPDLNITPYDGDILSAVKWSLEEFGPSKLGVVDVDLAFQLRTNGKNSQCPSAWNVLEPVLDELLSYGFCGKVLLTFVKQRDRYFGSDKARKAWLRRRLPSRVKLVRLVPYRSYRFDDWARYSQGSAMGVVELKLSGRAR